MAATLQQEALCIWVGGKLNNLHFYFLEKKESLAVFMYAYLQNYFTQHNVFLFHLFQYI